MASEFITGDGVFLAVWGRASKRDVDSVLEHLEAAFEEYGEPVIYITRVPANAPAPDSTVRRYIDEAMPKVTSLCSSYHVVLEGTGFTAAIKRGVLVSLFQIGRRRNMFFVHATPNEVLQHISADRQAAVRSVLTRADTLGLIRGAAPVSRAPLVGAGFSKSSGVHNARGLAAEFREARLK